MKKCLFATILCMVMLFGSLSPFLIHSKAADSEENPALSALRSNFPSGSYWNHEGTSYATYNANRLNYNLRSTSTPCNHSKYGELHCSYSNWNYSGACGCNSFSSSTQCMGFARFVCNYLFASAPNGDGSIGNGWQRTSFDNLKSGDYIRYKRTSSHYGHSVIVLKKSGNTITVLECNYDGKCGIDWTRTISKSTLNGYYYVGYLTNPNNPQIDGSSNVTVDNRYPTPFKCRTISTSNVRCYSSVNGASAGNIYPEDDCVIEEIYTNGWLKCKCPWSDGTTKTVYVEKSAFINSSMTPASMTAPVYADTYLRTDAATRIGWIDPGDSITKVATSGSYTQIIYPASSGKRCAWVLTSKLEASQPDQVNTYPLPFICRTLSTEKVKCYNDVNYSSSPGYIYPQDDCIITAIYDNGRVQCSCPWNDGTTKTVYVDKSAFLISDAVPVKMTAPKYALTYISADAGSSWGWIDAGDIIYTVATRGSRTQVFYPASTGTRCAWVNTADLTQTYSVSYNANGGSGAPATQTKNHGSNIVLSSTQPIRTGYTFLGWSTHSGATSAEYAPGSSYNKDANITLYAVWKIKQYNITFNANGGFNTPEPQVKTHGTTLTLSNAKPEKVGHTFLGWARSSSATVPDFSAGGSFTSDETTVLYAVWKVNTYKITYNANGGTKAPSYQTKTYYVEIVLTEEIPEREGYEFKGWSTNSEATEAEFVPGEVFAMDGDITLFAVWQEILPTYTSGDINGDDVVNNKDLTRLMKHLAGEDVEVVEEALDVNGDGAVNNKDLTRLMKYLAGEDVVIS